MKNIITISILIALIASISSCSKDDYELSNSVFVRDSEYPELPAYSEWGYNTFGAYYDRREAIISNDTKVPLKILAHNDTTFFIFSGEKGYDEFKIIISMGGLYPKTNLDLLNLNDKEFDLSAPNCNTITVSRGDTTKINVIAGILHFKKAQNLLVDMEQTEIILSGTFYFQFINNNEPVAVSDGRFDVGMSKYNFFSY